MTYAMQTTIPSIMGRNSLEKLFDNFFTNPQWSQTVRQSTSGYPVTDIYRDDDDNQVIEMALAGFTKESVNVETQANQITICSDGFETSRGGRIARRSFSKTFVDYNNELDMEAVTAKFENGLLRVVLPAKTSTKKLTVNIE